jgi:ectoine hydroxylase-related dioxygenase (phytanoyl-CoA dioxygenase family)
VPLHENVLPIVERVPDQRVPAVVVLLAGARSGQEAQPIHEDTQLIPCRGRTSRSRECDLGAVGFRDDNGATRIVPGSHKFDFLAGIRQGYDAVTATMPAAA